MPDPARVLPARLRAVTRRALNQVGIEVSRSPYANQLMARLNGRAITTVVDIGANEGQYATKLLEAGYRGAIVSVEPLQAPFQRLSDRAAGRDGWAALRLAMSDRSGEVVVNVAGNSQSSSVLDMHDLHAAAAPESVYIGTEQVPASTVDQLFDERGLDAAHSLLKIDVQGYESTVLDGADEVLRTIAMVEMELSLAPLYDGQALMPELLERLAARGLVLWSLRPAFADARDGRLLQVDGGFARVTDRG